MKHFSDEELKTRLSEEEYRVLREKGTEAPFSGDFVMPDRDNEYYCKVCGEHLFSGQSQHESMMVGLRGWPSFDSAAKEGAIVLEDDDSMGMRRTEVLCGNCRSHLGHLFDDSSTPTGKHYCINSVCLKSQKAG